MCAATLGLAVSVASGASAKTSGTCDSGHRASAACHKSKTAKDTKPTHGQSKKGAKAAKRVDPHAPALDATTLACNQEYEANKAAIDGGGQSKAKFIKDCKNGVEVIPGGNSVAGAPPPAVDGPPPDKQLPPASMKNGRPVASQDADTPTGSTRRRNQ